jgi:hypothetical protein
VQSSFQIPVYQFLVSFLQRSANKFKLSNSSYPFFQQVYVKLEVQKPLIVTAVGKLLARRRKKDADGVDDGDERRR